DEKPDCIINMGDATNLERNLYLTTQILEIDVPIVIALNMIDAVEKRGDYIDAKILEERLGVPVVTISALKSTGLDKLMERGYETAKKERKGKTVIEDTELKHLVGDLTIALSGQGVDNPVFHAVKLAELDDLEVLMHQDTVAMVDAFKNENLSETFGDDFEALIADARYKYITRYFSPAIKRKVQDKFVITPSDKADKILTHRIWSIPIFLLIIFAIFHLTFGEDFLFLGSIFKFRTLKDLGYNVDKFSVKLLATIYDGKIFSPGVFLSNFVNLLTSELTDVIRGLLVNTTWIKGLVCDGILGGVFAIIGFLPQILVLFLLFSILEDSGYMARIAFILDRILRKFGLSGRAFLPMIMGFGCSVPAMINTRTLADEKEKIATVRVIPFFSCGAKLPILTAVAGAIMKGTGSADLITYSMYVLGILTALFCVVVMRSTTLKGEAPPFIMELPTYHMPQFKNLMILIWDKAEHFIKKAFTIILASTIVVWFLMHFSFSWEYVESDIENSILANFGKLILPIFTPLGFGSQLNEYGWVFIVCALCGLIAKENVVAVMGTIASIFVGASLNSGASYVSVMQEMTGITIPALLAFIVFNMTTIPCSAAVATAKGEMPNKKLFKGTIFFWIIVSFIVSSMVYTIGSWWWTSFIWLAVLVSTLYVLKVIKKKGKTK
ncbi:MAG: ferrous iron transporter B, partial [Firmicutes bacterium]|nr:ferrous iron transporter B [Candidatus Caballimonas caccae]